MTRLYVAGASSELDRAEKWIEASRRVGFVVTYDWVASIKSVGQANPMENARKFAQDSIDAVRDSDVLWWLFPRENRASQGAAFEAGYALVSEEREVPTRVIVSGDFHKSIFTSLCERQFTADIDAFVWLRENFWVPGDR